MVTADRILQERVKQRRQARLVPGVLQVDRRDRLMAKALDHAQLRRQDFGVQAEDALQLCRWSGIDDGVDLQCRMITAAADGECPAVFGAASQVDTMIAPHLAAGGRQPPLYGVRQRRREVRPGQPHLRGGGPGAQAVTQHRRQRLRGGLLDRCVQCSERQRSPHPLDQARSLSLFAQPVARRPVGPHNPPTRTQPRQQPDERRAVGPRKPSGRQQRGCEVPRCGKPGRAQGGAVGVDQLKRPTIEGAVQGHAEFIEQRRRRRVGPDQQVLAVVQRVRLCAQVKHETARATAQFTAGFQQEHVMAVAHAGGGRRAAGPSRTDDGDAQPGRHADTQVFQAIQSLRSGVSAIRWCRTRNSSRSTSSSSVA